MELNDALHECFGRETTTKRQSRLLWSARCLVFKRGGEKFDIHDPATMDESSMAPTYQSLCLIRHESLTAGCRMP